MTKIIAINGFKRSGKGETGEAIKSVAYGFFLTATTLGFADKLKILAAKTLGFLDRSDEECIALMDECKEEWIFSIQKRIRDDFVSPTTGNFFPFEGRQEWHTLTGREFLQHLGTEARTVFGPDFWVNQALPKPCRAVATDNEPYAAARRQDERVVKAMYGSTDYLAITDCRFPNEAQRVLDLGGEVWEVLRPGTGGDGHVSEQTLPRELITRQIDNSGDLLALRYEVEKALGL